MIYLRQGRPAEALRVAQEAYRHNISTRARVALALACVRTGRLADAERLVATAKPKDLDSAYMKLVRAELSLRQGDEPAAKAHFTAYTDQEDRKTRNKALLEAGIVWLEQDRPAEAEALFAKIDADPKLTAKARLNLGIARARGNDLPAAIMAFRGAIEADPDSAEAHGNLGRALLLSGDRVAALQHLTRSRTLSGRPFPFDRELQEASRVPPTPAPDVSVPEVPLP
jgi:Tfp pilus assembly protein PilF